MLFNTDNSVHWFLEKHYTDYKKFLGLFDGVPAKYHLERGGSNMYYKWDYSYPLEVDPDKEYLEFLKDSISGIAPDAKYASSWWVDYPNGTYSVAHQHVQTKRLTAIMFLTDYEWIRAWPVAGNLYAMSNLIGYKEWTPNAGDVIIMDGGMYHGSYPAINERKVFVVDFEYN